MLGNFSYCNPTKLYFGDDSLKYLNDELPKYGKNVVLVYGRESIKKNGIYDDVVDILKENGKNIADLGVTEDMIEKVADSTIILSGGYKAMEYEDIIKVLKMSI